MPALQVGEGMRSPYLDDGDVRLYLGDCIAVMAEMDEGSVDAVVCDPPYGLEFMGKDWDAPWKDSRAYIGRGGDIRGSKAPMLPQAYIAGASFAAWCETWAREALRVLKPGGHLLAFGGTRTYHRLTCGIEDAGFEVRDSIAWNGAPLPTVLQWVYGSGFPKSLDVSKAIDKAAGQQGEVVRQYETQIGGVTMNGGRGQWRGTITHRAPATDAARQWQGWGTALKPGWEPCVVARKPLAGTVAENVQAHGTGAINVDGCRIPHASDADLAQHAAGVAAIKARGGSMANSWKNSSDLSGANEVQAAGRWPANVVLDEQAAAMLDAQSGERKSPATYTRGVHAEGEWLHAKPAGSEQPGYGDTGGASRFFYTAKASRADRSTNGANNTHPTVKPTDLMRWLVRLVTPPGGVVLDPFAGSGSTLVAARAEGVRCIGIEREDEYAQIITQRLSQLSLFSDGAE